MGETESAPQDIIKPIIFFRKILQLIQSEILLNEKVVFCIKQIFSK